jgi:hypothetical protein
MPECRAGWRLISCEECGFVAWIATRDCYSPSRECCSFCYHETDPLEFERDPEIEVDAFCNVIGSPRDLVLRPGSKEFRPENWPSSPEADDHSNFGTM